jgi:hypothetical protein
MVEPLLDLADGAEVDRLTGALSGLRTKDFFRGAQDLAALGLNPPLFHVTLTGAKGAATAVDFGSTRSDGNTLYARREGQVLTVDRDIVDGSKEAEARSRTLLGLRRGGSSGSRRLPKGKLCPRAEDGG